MDDRFSQTLGAVRDGVCAGGTLTTLAQRYSYVLPDERSLSAVADLDPLVEIGAGTGYWAYRLRARGADVIAIDQAPPHGARVNRYHPTTTTWTEVIAGDHTSLTRYADRALLLCWPPLYSALGESLTYYDGNTVAVIGDGGHRTARIQGLNDTFTLASVWRVQAVEPHPEHAPTLSIWRRRSTA